MTASRLIVDGFQASGKIWPDVGFRLGADIGLSLLEVYYPTRRWMMSEFELLEVLNGILSNAISQQGIFFTMLSAYIVMAYVAGSRLTTYQAGFVSLVFLVFSAVATVANTSVMIEMNHYTELLREIRGRDLGAGKAKILEDPVVFVLVTIRIAMSLGALAFMWTVRHPKAE